MFARFKFPFIAGLLKAALAEQQAPVEIRLGGNRRHFENRQADPGSLTQFALRSRPPGEILSK